MTEHKKRKTEQKAFVVYYDDEKKWKLRGVLTGRSIYLSFIDLCNLTGERGGSTTRYFELMKGRRIGVLELVKAGFFDLEVKDGGCGFGSGGRFVVLKKAIVFLQSRGFETNAVYKKIIDIAEKFREEKQLGTTDALSKLRLELDSVKSSKDEVVENIERSKNSISDKIEKCNKEIKKQLAYIMEMQRRTDAVMVNEQLEEIKNELRKLSGDFDNKESVTSVNWNEILCETFSTNEE